MALSRSRRSTSPQTHPRPDISRCMNLRYSLHTREIIIPSPLNSTLDHVAPQGHHLHDQPLALRRCHEVGSLSRAWGCHCSAYPRDVQGLTTQKVSCSCIDFLKTLSIPCNSNFQGGGPVCSSQLDKKTKLHFWIRSSKTKLNEESEKHRQDDQAPHRSARTFPHS